MDAYQAIRSLSFPSLASALGIDLTHFKRRSNGEYYGNCPVHKSKLNQTSFSYHPDGRFNCFSCSAKGRGGVDLAMKIRNVGFKAAVEFLSPVASTVQPDTKKPPTVISDAAEATGELKPFTGKYHKYAVPCPWLEQRIPDAAIREKYAVFCYNNPTKKSAYSGRVMLPVKDESGQLFGYLGRRITPSSQSHDSERDSPKYLFPKNLPKSRFLFGAHELWEDRPHRIVYLVESPFCVMKFASLGIPAVSPYGWSVSDEQVRIVASLAKGVVFLPDANKFGECGSSVQALARLCWVRTPALPENCIDPEHLSREQILAL